MKVDELPNKCFICSILHLKGFPKHQMKLNISKYLYSLVPEKYLQFPGKLGTQKLLFHLWKETESICGYRWKQVCLLFTVFTWHFFLLKLYISDNIPIRWYAHFLNHQQTSASNKQSSISEFNFFTKINNKIYLKLRRHRCFFFRKCMKSKFNVLRIARWLNSSIKFKLLVARKVLPTFF